MNTVGKPFAHGACVSNSAGTGISHSEYNASRSAPVHFLQIWIVPATTGLAPGYEQRAFALDEHLGQWVLVASKDGRDGSVTVHQDANVWAIRCAAARQAVFRLEPGRRAWLQLARGEMTVNGTLLTAGHGAAAIQEPILECKAIEQAEMLLFDLP